MKAPGPSVDSYQKRSPNLATWNCLAMMQAKVGPTTPPGSAFSLKPPGNRSMSSTSLKQTWEYDWWNTIRADDNRQPYAGRWGREGGKKGCRKEGRREGAAGVAGDSCLLFTSIRASPQTCDCHHLKDNSIAMCNLLVNSAEHFCPLWVLLVHIFKILIHR